MSRRRLAAATALAVALAPVLAAGQTPPPGSAPLPPVKPATGAATEPGVLAYGGASAPGEMLSSEPEEMPAVETAQPPGLLADPALAADLGAFLAGQQAAAGEPDAAPAPSAAAAPVAEIAPPRNAAAVEAEAGEEQTGAGTDMAWAEPDAAPAGPAPVEPLFVWGDGPLDAAGAARLFEVACLGTLPEFAGVGAFFEALGFVTVPGMRIRNHPQKHVSALATTTADLMESGVRSCAILVEGLEQAPAAAAVEALVAERFADARRFDTPARDIAHVVWVVDTSIGPAKVTVTQSGGSSFIGATVLPPVGSARPSAEAWTDGG